MEKKFLPAYLLTFVNFMGFSILIPVLPFVVKKYGAPDYVYGLLLSAYALFQFIGSPYLGRLSDTLGRKPVLFVSHIGTLLSWFVFGAAYFIHPSEAWWFLPLIVIAFARIVDGLTGGNVSVTNAYISDISTHDEKSHIFGYLGGIGGLAMIIGPGIGGFSSSGSIGYLGTVIVSIIMSGLTLLSLFLWLKESLAPDLRRHRQAFSLSRIINVPKRIKELQPSALVKKVLWLRLIFSTAMAFYIASIVLFTIDRFGLNEKTLGLFMIFVGIFLSFNQVVVYKRVVQRVGELKTLLIGFTCMALGFIAITITHNFLAYIPLYFILNLGLSLTMPVFNSLLSKHCKPSIQGEILGISESLASISNAIWPVISATLYQLIGFYVFYGIALLPISAIFILRVFIKKEIETPSVVT